MERQGDAYDGGIGCGRVVALVLVALDHSRDGADEEHFGCWLYGFVCVGVIEVLVCLDVVTV